jgi:hypothetical protein
MTDESLLVVQTLVGEVRQLRKEFVSSMSEVRRTQANMVEAIKKQDVRITRVESEIEQLLDWSDEQKEDRRFNLNRHDQKIDRRMAVIIGLIGAFAGMGSFAMALMTTHFLG